MSILRTSTSTRWRSARLSSAWRLRRSVVSESEPPERWSHRSCGRLPRAVATISCSETKFAAARSSMRGYLRGFSFCGVPGALPAFFAMAKEWVRLDADALQHIIAITLARARTDREDLPEPRHLLRREA